MSHSVAPSPQNPDAAIARARAAGALANPAQEAKRLELILTPATEAEGLRELFFLFKNLPMGGIDVDAPDGERETSERIMLEGYKLAIRGYPRWAIVEACDAFRGGRVAAHEGAFAPNSAVLGRECARLVDDHRARLGRAKRRAEEESRLDDGPNEPLSEATREYARRRVEELRARSEEKRRMLGGGRTRAPAPEEAIPEEMLEAMRQLPDAPARAGTSAHRALPDRFGIGRGCLKSQP